VKERSVPVLFDPLSKATKEYKEKEKRERKRMELGRRCRTRSAGITVT